MEEGREEEGWKKGGKRKDGRRKGSGRMEEGREVEGWKKGGRKMLVSCSVQMSLCLKEEGKEGRKPVEASKLNGNQLIKGMMAV